MEVIMMVCIKITCQTGQGNFSGQMVLNTLDSGEVEFKKEREYRYFKMEKKWKEFGGMESGKSGFEWRKINK